MTASRQFIRAVNVLSTIIHNLKYTVTIKLQCGGKTVVGGACHSVWEGQPAASAEDAVASAIIKAVKEDGWEVSPEGHMLCRHCAAASRGCYLCEWCGAEVPSGTECDCPPPI